MKDSKNECFSFFFTLQVGETRPPSRAFCIKNVFLVSLFVNLVFIIINSKPFQVFSSVFMEQKKRIKKYKD